MHYISTLNVACRNVIIQYEENISDCPLTLFLHAHTSTNIYFGLWNMIIFYKMNRRYIYRYYYSLYLYIYMYMHNKHVHPVEFILSMQLTISTS